MPSKKSPNESGGLVVKINLFSLDRHTGEFSSKAARLWMKGQAVNQQTDEKVIFNDAGQLITALGKWNSQQFQKLQKSKKQGGAKSDA